MRFSVGLSHICHIFIKTTIYSIENATYTTICRVK
nr:MAG TPA: hypothetical protein [Caudoviricetes sp.]